MLRLRKAAITGGLSSGKSSVCRFLKDAGAYVTSADSIVHQLISSDPILAQEIVCVLGPNVLINQKLDRHLIASIVFQDLDLLKALEAILHPAVYDQINKEYLEQQNRLDPPPLFVAEIPLLFETGRQKDYDITVTVLADKDICCKRFQETTGLSQQDFEIRMARQLPLPEKGSLADYVITNNGTLSDLRKATIDLYHRLT